MMSALLFLLVSIHIANSENVSACIWGRSRDGLTNVFMNGVYEYQGELNGAPWYRKSQRNPNIPYLYLWRDYKVLNYQYVITESEPQSYVQSLSGNAYCNIPTNVPWECELNGLNQWRVYDINGQFPIDPQVYSQPNTCPEWDCDAIKLNITTSNLNLCDDIFDVKIKRNVWSNHDGTQYFWFGDGSSTWYCTLEHEYKDTDSLIASFARTQPTDWINLTKGDSVMFKWKFPDNGTHPIECLDIQPTSEPTYDPSEVPTGSPSYHPSNGPTASPITTLYPTIYPSDSPTFVPSNDPSDSPTTYPSLYPSRAPTYTPSDPPIPTNGTAPSSIPTEEPTTFILMILNNEPTAEPTIETAEVSTHCDDIIVEIMNLDGITSYDFVRDQELRIFMVNTTSQGIGNHAINYRIDESSFYIHYKSVSDDINITFATCGETEQVLSVLNDIVTAHSNDIARYIKNETVQYFEAITEVSTNNITINIYWGSYVMSSISSSKETLIASVIALIIEIPSLYVTMIIFAFFLLFTFIAFIDAKCLRKNDYFSATTIIISSFEVSDAATDLLFAMALLMRYFSDERMDVFIACNVTFAFIIISMTFSIFQLIYQVRKSWFKEYGNWLKKYGKVLFLFSFISGSAYTACEMVNCGALKLQIFNMGLNQQERIKFNAKRVIGIVCLENIPQMVVQIWYLMKFRADFVAVVSLTFSVISILLTVFTIYTQRMIIRNEEIIRIEFDIISDEIESSLSTKTHGIKCKLCMLLGVQENLMEIQRPKVVPNGLRFEICLFSNVQDPGSSFKALVNSSISGGALANIAQKMWDLEAMPEIENVIYISGDLVGEVIELKSVDVDGRLTNNIDYH